MLTYWQKPKYVLKFVIRQPFFIHIIIIIIFYLKYNFSRGGKAVKHKN